MSYFPRYDDVGGFPLPWNVNKDSFNDSYWTAYHALLKKTDIFEHRGILSNFVKPIEQGFLFKLRAGVEVVNYPQHMDIYSQFLKPMEEYSEGPDLIEKSKALIPEVKVIENLAKKEFEKTQKPIELKLCITGPIDLYVKKHGYSLYKDMALNFSRSIKRFLQNSIINNKYLRTTVVSIDEPSFGFVDIMGVSDEDLIDIFDKSVEGLDVISQIHLHSLNRADIPLQSDNIDCLTCEYASDKSNKIPKKDLDSYDKSIRVGITRTRIDNIIGEAIENGRTWEDLKTIEGTLSLIDDKETIKKTLVEALDHYGDRLMFTGPDCGVKGWSPPEVAYELLKRTHSAIQEVKKTY